MSRSETVPTGGEARTDVRNEGDVVQAVHSARVRSGGRLGELLVERGDLSPETLRKALDLLHHQPPGHRRHLGQLLVEKGWVPAGVVHAALAKQFGIPQLRIAGLEISPKVAAMIPDELATRHGVLPLARIGNLLVVAMGDPFDEHAIAELRFYTGCNIEPVLADAREIGELQNRYYVSEAASRAASELRLSQPASTPEAHESAPEQAQRRPVVKLVNSVLLQAVHRGASDIHIRPEHHEATILFRVDGRLQVVRTLEHGLLAAVVARIKIAGGMDVAEHRLPQDGHMRLHVGEREIDLRVSVMPTSRGESVVIRVLDRERGLKRFDQLGFSPEDLRRLKQIISRPNGMLLVTGPTGSGKSTTLYAMLDEVRRGDPHVITVEDPVEYDIAGVEQIQIHSAIGYTFAEALRHILRHDPDVIMVGEIRDLETARIANKAALTGHLVLSTLHTNDAASAATRLIDMGVEPYLLSTTLLGTMAQRLIRLNCPDCLTEEKPDPLVRETLGVSDSEVFRVGAGCPACGHTGYRGRTVVYELMTINAAVAELIGNSPRTSEVKAAAMQAGMVPLTQRALEMAREGRTSLQEVYSIRLE